MVRGTVEEALNAMLDAEADRLCGAGRYECSDIAEALWGARVSPSAVPNLNKKILGICEGAKEDRSGWSAFFRPWWTAGSRAWI
jgi:transposase-like protein